MQNFENTKTNEEMEEDSLKIAVIDNKDKENWNKWELLANFFEILNVDVQFSTQLKVDKDPNRKICFFYTTHLDDDDEFNGYIYLWLAEDPETVANKKTAAFIDFPTTIRKMPTFATYLESSWFGNNHLVFNKKFQVFLRKANGQNLPCVYFI